MKEIWIVSEENHGDVSYWEDKEKAKEEITKIAHSIAEDSQKIILKETERFIYVANEECNGLVYGYKVKLNVSWG